MERDARQHLAHYRTVTLGRGDWTIGTRDRTTAITLHWNGPAVAPQRQRGDGVLEQLRIDTKWQTEPGWGGSANGGDGLQYHAAIGADGVLWRCRNDDARLWHCGHTEGNAESLSLHLLVGIGQAVTAVQWDAALRIIERWRTQYHIRRDRVMGHQEWVANACPGPDIMQRLRAYRAKADPPAASDGYHEDSPVMGPPRGTTAQAIAWFTARSKNYSPQAIVQIVACYERLGNAAGVDWFLALAQSAHETANWSSALSARPVRNPAGIGVTGAWSHQPRDGYVWDADRLLYRACVTFPAWTPEESAGAVSSVEAHLGRLIAYATLPGERFGPSQYLADRALLVRNLPLIGHGTARTLKPLGRAHNPRGNDGIGWASPGDNYGAAIANLANRMRGL